MILLKMLGPACPASQKKCFLAKNLLFPGKYDLVLEPNTIVGLTILNLVGHTYRAFDVYWVMTRTTQVTSFCGLLDKWKSTGKILNMEADLVNICKQIKPKWDSLGAVGFDDGSDTVVK